MTDLITRTEYLVIGSTPLATPAWRVNNIDVMWNTADVRGSDRIIPGAAGTRPYQRRFTVTKRSLEMVVFGAQDRTGATNADPRLGLWNNVKALRSLAAPTGSGDGTLAATLYLPTGASPSTLTGYVHIEGFEIGPIHRHTVRATMDLSFPFGMLA